MKKNALLVASLLPLVGAIGCTEPGVAKTCLAGSTDCGSGCVTLGRDQLNCGTCGNACGHGLTCVSGACTPTYTLDPSPLLIDDAQYLYVPPGTTYTLSGDRCYTQNVVIDGVVNVAPFDGTSGGALMIRSRSIRVRSGGAIVANAVGRPGALQAPTGGGLQGGGLGSGCGGGPGSCVGQGGSGAGYGGAGGKPDPTNPFATAACNACNNPSVAHCEGAPGVAYGTAAGIDVDLGSGGGSAGNSCSLTNAGGRGGAGGGMVALLATEVTIDGTITAGGEKPPAATLPANDYRPGGGGGSGGAILVRAENLGGAGQLLAPGGGGGNSPGTGSPTADWGWAGGGGGGGRVKIFATTDGFTGAVGAAAGAGGVATCAGTNCRSGAPGAAGTISRTTIPPELTIGCAGL